MNLCSVGNDNLRQDSNVIGAIEPGRNHVDVFRDELAIAEQNICTLLQERKLLKEEKVDLLHQINDLYDLLQEKDNELADFVSGYDRRMRENERVIEGLVAENEKLSRERAELFNQVEALDGVSCNLRVRVNFLERIIGRSPAVSPSSAPAVFSEPTRHRSYDLLNDHQAEYELLGGRRSRDGLMKGSAIDPLVLNSPQMGKRSTSSLECLNLIANVGNAVGESRRNRPRRGTTRFLTQPVAVVDPPVSHLDLPSSPPSVFGSESGSPRYDFLQHPISSWDPVEVATWVCSVVPLVKRENMSRLISGKELLEMRSEPICRDLGITHVLHWRRVCASMDYLKFPFPCYVKLSSIHLDWVTQVWLRGLGLGQLSVLFRYSFVDAVVLETLTEQDLTTHLNICNKLHRSSLLTGRHLLRLIDWKLEELSPEKRKKARDLMLMTNEDLHDWLIQRSIELDSAAFSSSGIHGALLVLDTDFDLSSFRHYIRRGGFKKNESVLADLEKLKEESRKTWNVTTPGKAGKGRLLSRSFSLRLRRPTTDSVSLLSSTESVLTNVSVNSKTASYNDKVDTNSVTTRTTRSASLLSNRSDIVSRKTTRRLHFV